MSEPPFDDLYRELILDHYRRPRNHGPLAAPTVQAEGVNPVCGDEIHLDLAIDNGVIADLGFWGQGCSISQSSASMLTERLKGRPLAEAEEVAGKVRSMLVEGASPDPSLGDLEALEGVAKLPVRVKCALLAWNVLLEALRQAKAAAQEEHHG
ncbi:Fe-S cluster assembly sulfur transfer protein SufU [Tepidiforma bonchosmolovskayae]|uniref:SUF system NifU family Fe-S cluster assembly protein n=1 Tax=Tepidiforma bonchosmolovskayae TaxID=2601677 RepID=A0ABX6BYT0_9CHLR|nr:SUF system NifU family Fe-S cluster assembly protein [Tepidiforma bonchosmolovskayae]QFG02129.1 SUF system NifU family Fe-S cluster assembly protein [Tepidiforma bonchosmolovskayae]GIW14144.1 MAG: iron-sulfur cluster assembly scaffold protein [Tepidiforma sp.]